MITTTVTSHISREHTTDAYALFLHEGFSSADISSVEPLYADVQKLIKAKEFEGKEGQELIIPTLHHDKAITLMLMGIGASHATSTDRVETYRRALGRAVKNAAAVKAESLTCIVPKATTLGIDAQRLGYETVLTIAMTDYHFDEYITKKSKKLQTLTICAAEHDAAAVEKGIAQGTITATAVNKTRHWIDLPPAAIHPISLANQAVEIGKKHPSITVKVFGDKEATELGMGGLLGVSRGSEHECRLVVMEYKSHKKDAPTVALVGKGITFDSGGLSIKPANSMETMKDDMSGAAAVIATMEALASLKPEINVIGVAAMAENMPSGNATRPGDILKFYNGKTAEVKNTDAEGRLVLADALSYTVDVYKPDAIIDIATLTGACAYALGPLFSGMMSQHDDLASRVEKAGTVSGDRVWRLPMSNDYKKAIKSTVADICNIGSKSYNAGTITAAFFLKEFVGNTPWVHLDIAGTAFDVPDISYYRPGATGVGVRLFIDLITDWK